MTQQTYPKRSFGSAAAEAQSVDSGATVAARHDDQGGKRSGNGPLFSTRTLVIGASLLVGGILCSIAATGFSGGGTVVSAADKPEIFGLRQQIQTAKSNTESFPDANAAERSLVRAQTAAGEVAELQNGYLGLAAAVAAADGKLDAAQTVNQRRDLIPYFDRGMAPAVVEPWYLLASDAKVPAGAGIPELFDSGVAWVAQARRQSMPTAAFRCLVGDADAHRRWRTEGPARLGTGRLRHHATGVHKCADQHDGQRRYSGPGG
ncbi:hypothetical protein AHiyo8_02180 [Arthrobacter sp. Hiyo8]|nr:hypothetical protein AHiyo8_02180 [Arthrobacter sp. Hiyo8]